LAGGLHLITLRRRNLKPRLMRLWDRLMLRKRSLIETSNANLKNVSQIEHARHRSLSGFMVHVVGALIAYTSQPQKPSLGLWHGASGLPAVVGLSRIQVTLLHATFCGSRRWVTTVGDPVPGTAMCRAYPASHGATCGFNSAERHGKGCFRVDPTS
jgi:hypothetical protein